MTKVLLVVELSETTEDDYTFYEFESVTTVANEIPEDRLLGVSEHLVQSDFHTIGFANAMADAVTSTSGTNTVFNHKTY